MFQSDEATSFSGSHTTTAYYPGSKIAIGGHFTSVIVGGAFDGQSPEGALDVNGAGEDSADYFVTWANESITGDTIKVTAYVNCVQYG